MVSLILRNLFFQGGGEFEKKYLFEFVQSLFFFRLIQVDRILLFDSVVECNQLTNKIDMTFLFESCEASDYFLCVKSARQ